MRFSKLFGGSTASSSSSSLTDNSASSRPSGSPSSSATSGSTAPMSKQHIDHVQGSIYRDALMLRHAVMNGSRFAPMKIEPQPHERNRLDHSLGTTPMNNRQRELRKQWVEDHNLAQDEPRYVPALQRKAWFHKLYDWPLDKLFWSLRPIVGHRPAMLMRMKFSKAIGVLLVANASAYAFYYSNGWEMARTFHYPSRRPTVYPGDPKFEEALKNMHNFPSPTCDAGFSERTSMRADSGEFRSSSPTTHDPEYFAPAPGHGDVYLRRLASREGFAASAAALHANTAATPGH